MPLTDAQQEVLRKEFYGGEGRFFAQSVDKFIAYLKKSGHNDIPVNQIANWYNSQEVVQIMRPGPKTTTEERQGKAYFHIIEFMPFNRFYLDTMYMKRYGIGILCGLDLFSRYAWAKVFQQTYRDSGISASKALTAFQGFEQNIHEMGYDVLSVYVDDGSEFKGKFRQYCDSKGYDMTVSNPVDPRKNRNLERFNGTLRLLIEKYYNTYRGRITQKIIDQLLEAYNTNVHSSLYGFSPLEVLASPDVQNDIMEFNKRLKEEDLATRPVDRPLRVGTWVRWFTRYDSKYRKLAKNWSSTLYQIESYSPSNQSYRLGGLPKKEFRAEQLQVVNKRLFDLYNYRPPRRGPQVVEDRPRRPVAITRDVKDVLNAPIQQGKRERKANPRFADGAGVSGSETADPIFNKVMVKGRGQVVSAVAKRAAEIFEPPSGVRLRTGSDDEEKEKQQGYDPLQGKVDRLGDLWRAATAALRSAGLSAKQVREIQEQLAQAPPNEYGGSYENTFNRRAERYEQVLEQNGVYAELPRLTAELPGQGASEEKNEEKGGTGLRKPSAYNLFVKKHMSKRPAGVSVTEYMRTIAQKWKKQKR